MRLFSIPCLLTFVLTSGIMRSLPNDEDFEKTAHAHYLTLHGETGLSLAQFVDSVVQVRGFLDDHEYVQPSVQAASFHEFTPFQISLPRPREVTNSHSIALATSGTPRRLRSDSGSTLIQWFIL